VTPHEPSRCPADDALIEQFTPTKEQIMSAIKTQTAGIAVSTAITAGPGSGAGGVWLNHSEGLVAR
jgi:hypothetical protein